MIIFYNIFMCLIFIFGLPIIAPFMLCSKKRRKNFWQRLGFNFKLPCVKKNSIWIHALSVGEVVSAKPFVEKMAEKFGHKNIIFSASTLTGFETANHQFKKIPVFFFPFDIIFSVKRVLKAVQPKCVIIVETDLWPNFIKEVKQKNIPIFLINARLSKRSFKGYKRLEGLIKPLLQSFDHVCVQSAQDARRFFKLGVRALSITGNMKFDQKINQFSDAQLSDMRHKLHISADKKIIVAGSTHNGEEIIILNAFQRLKQKIPHLCLIIAPRNPKRAYDVCKIFDKFSSNCLADMEKNPQKSDVIVIDRIGLLQKLYALADAAFVGGSLIDRGGHNPLEPAALAKPVVFGSYMSDFQEISQKLINASGAVQVSDSDEFYQIMLNFFKNPQKAQIIGQNAWRVFESNKGAVEKTIQLIEII